MPAQKKQGSRGEPRHAEDAPAPRPLVGQKVKVLEEDEEYKGSLGELLEDLGGKRPFKVKLPDGKIRMLRDSEVVGLQDPQGRPAMVERVEIGAASPASGRASITKWSKQKEGSYAPIGEDVSPRRAAPKPAPAPRWENRRLLPLLLLAVAGAFLAGRSLSSTAALPLADCSSAEAELRSSQQRLADLHARTSEAQEQRNHAEKRALELEASQKSLQEKLREKELQLARTPSEAENRTLLQRLKAANKSQTKELKQARLELEAFHRLQEVNKTQARELKQARLELEAFHRLQEENKTHAQELQDARLQLGGLQRLQEANRTQTRDLKEARSHLAQLRQLREANETQGRALSEVTGKLKTVDAQRLGATQELQTAIASLDDCIAASNRSAEAQSQALAEITAELGVAKRRLSEVESARPRLSEVESARSDMAATRKAMEDEWLVEDTTRALQRKGEELLAARELAAKLEVELKEHRRRAAPECEGLAVREKKEIVGDMQEQCEEFLGQQRVNLLRLCSRNVNFTRRQLEQGRELWPGCAERASPPGSGRYFADLSRIFGGAADVCWSGPGGCGSSDNFGTTRKEECANACAALPHCSGWQHNGVDRCFLRTGEAIRESLAAAGSRQCRPPPTPVPAVVLAFSVLELKPLQECDEAPEECSQLRAAAATWRFAIEKFEEFLTEWSSHTGSMPMISLPEHGKIRLDHALRNRADNVQTLLSLRTEVELGEQYPNVVHWNRLVFESCRSFLQEEVQGIGVDAARATRDASLPRPLRGLLCDARSPRC